MRATNPSCCARSYFLTPLSGLYFSDLSADLRLDRMVQNCNKVMVPCWLGQGANPDVLTPGPVTIRQPAPPRPTQAFRWERMAHP